MKFARGLDSFLRIDSISVDDHDHSQVFFHLTVQWWTLEGLRTWFRCWHKCVGYYDISPWNPRALYQLVVRFPGWTKASR